MFAKHHCPWAGRCFADEQSVASQETGPFGLLTHFRGGSSMRTPNLKPLRILATLLLLTTSTVASAQAGGISGRILDPFGALVPGAKVELIQDGKPVAEAVSDEKGNFHFVSLATGR